MHFLRPPSLRGGEQSNLNSDFIYCRPRFLTETSSKMGMKQANFRVSLLLCFIRTSFPPPHRMVTKNKSKNRVAENATIK